MDSHDNLLCMAKTEINKKATNKPIIAVVMRTANGENDDLKLKILLLQQSYYLMLLPYWCYNKKIHDLRLVVVDSHSQQLVGTVTITTLQTFSINLLQHVISNNLPQLTELVCILNNTGTYISIIGLHNFNTYLQFYTQDVVYNDNLKSGASSCLWWLICCLFLFSKTIFRTHLQ